MMKATRRQVARLASMSLWSVRSAGQAARRS